MGGRRRGGGCDYHWAPHLNVTADSVSGDGRIAAFCANYEKPKEPVLYVKDLGTGALTRTDVLCGSTGSVGRTTTTSAATRR